MNIQTNEALLTQATVKSIEDNPKFQQLVRARSSLGWALSAVMCFVYFGLILLVAFDKPLIAEKVGAGPTSVGIVLGIAVIVVAIALVGFYVIVANSRFDRMARELNSEIGR